MIAEGQLCPVAEVSVTNKDYFKDKIEITSWVTKGKIYFVKVVLKEPKNEKEEKWYRVFKALTEEGAKEKLAEWEKKVHHSYWTYKPNEVNKAPHQLCQCSVCRRMRTEPGYAKPMSWWHKQLDKLTDGDTSRRASTHGLVINLV